MHMGTSSSQSVSQSILLLLCLGNLNHHNNNVIQYTCSFVSSSRSGWRRRMAGWRWASQLASTFVGLGFALFIYTYIHQKYVSTFCGYNKKKTIQTSVGFVSCLAPPPTIISSAHPQMEWWMSFCGRVSLSSLIRCRRRRYWPQNKWWSGGSGWRPEEKT